MKKFTKYLIVTTLIFLLFTLTTVNAATFTVTKTADTNDGVCDMDCSLREAIAEANSAATDDIIEFDPNIFNTAQIIILNNIVLTVDNNGSLTINGPGAELLSISGNNQTRAFFNNGATLEINDLSIIDCFWGGDGGAIRNNGTMTLNNLILKNNTAAAGGGAISNIGTLTINDSVIKENTAQGGNDEGGGIENEMGTLTINNSTIDGNTAQGRGGGLGNSSSGGTVIINASTFSNNAGFSGGGIYNAGNSGSEITLTNSTISNNTARSDGGGGIHNTSSASAKLVNVTVAENTALTDEFGVGRGGGVRSTNPHFVSRNTIFADNTDNGEGPDFSGPLDSEGNNILGDSTGAFVSGASAPDFLGIDPRLLPLGNYGGPTQTHALDPFSFAVDLIRISPDFPLVDQRGIPRPQEGNLTPPVLADVGAYERQPTIFTVTKVSDENNDGVCDEECSLREAIMATNLAQTPDNVILFDQDVFSTQQIITLTEGELVLNRTGTLMIRGTSFPESPIISGNDQSRVFSITPEAYVIFNGIKISNGNGVGATQNGRGGAVYNAGTVRILSSLIEDSSAGDFGGAVFNDINGYVEAFGARIRNNDSTFNGGGISNVGTLEIFSSAFTENSSRGGGAVFNDQGTTKVDLSTFDGNQAEDGGGGLYNSNGTMTVSRSTISNNTAGDNDNGGGIINISENGSLTIITSTISGNSADSGGGIHNDFGATLNVTSATIANNRARFGGGISNASGTATLGNTIVADNFATSGTSPDYFNTLNSLGFNLIENTNATIISGTTDSNITGIDPQLLPLGDYGGIRLTHALNPQSPAVDKGNSFELFGDQRIKTRPVDNPNISNAPGGDGADIGAFERQENKFSTNTEFDFDGDGKSDLGVFRPTESVWYLLQTQAGFEASQFGISDDKITPADFDGDNKTDIAVYREGVWYIYRSSDSSIFIKQFGVAGDLPRPGDFDGDGKADLAVFRPSQGTWYISNSSDNQVQIIPFGQNGDLPIIGDFDGDGKSDLTVWRPATGVWYSLKSSNGELVIFEFGLEGDIPAVGNFDGDAKTDFAVFRPTDGVWYILNSGDGRFTFTQFGISEDIPTVGDFDGDGKSDIAVYRPSEGNWYLLQSLDGFKAVKFGTTGDKPLQASFNQ